MGARKNDPTAEEAIRNLTRENAKLTKTLKVARMAIDVCLDEVARR